MSFCWLSGELSNQGERAEQDGSPAEVKGFSSNYIQKQRTWIHRLSRTLFLDWDILICSSDRWLIKISLINQVAVAGMMEQPKHQNRCPSSSLLIVLYGELKRPPPPDDLVARGFCCFWSVIIISSRRSVSLIFMLVSLASLIVHHGPHIFRYRRWWPRHTLHI